MLKIPVIDDLGTNLRIPLGQQGEDKAVTYLFDCSEWAEEHPDGVAVLHITRAQDKEEYLAVTSQNNAEVTWVVSNADTAYAGTSLCQLEWVFGDGLSKSFIFKGTIAKSLNPGSEPPTEITQRWVDKLIEEAYKINKAVEDGVTEITDLSSDEMKKIGVVAEEVMTGINTLATNKKNELEGIKSDADAIGKQLLKDAEDGKFDGKDGNDGYTPIKGKDYFTESEIDDIESGATDKVLDKTYSKETIDKKISDATPKDYDQLKVEVSNKVDKISGKGLSTNDYDATAKSKVDAIPSDPKYTDTIYDDTQVREGIEKNSKSIEELKLFKFPNANVVGEPLIESGNISRFSNADYLIFPFVVDVRNKPFEITMCFTTGSNVNTQQNVLDSAFGMALAIQNGKGVMALSSNGESWNIGLATGSITINPNTTYYAKVSWDGSVYKTSLSTDGETFTDDMFVASSLGLYPKTMYIGGSPDLFGVGSAHPFGGTINLNKCYLKIAGLDVWSGMDDAGLSTRADVSLSNLDAEGEKRFKDLHDEIDTTKEDLVTQSNQIEELDSEQKLLKNMAEDNLYSYEEVESEAYSVDVPSGAKLASVQKIGGKSIIFNQMLNPYTFVNSKTGRGVTFINNGDGSVTFYTDENGATSTMSFELRVNNLKQFFPNDHLILSTLGGGVIGSASTFNIIVYKQNDAQWVGQLNNETISKWNDGYNIRLVVWGGHTNTSPVTIKPMFIDLTAMFGSGNEPTLDQCKQIFTEDYYPYTEPTLKNAEVENVVIGETIKQVSEIISKYFPNGMKSAGSVYDEIDFENGKAVQRVGKVDLGSLDWQGWTTYKEWYAPFSSHKKPTTNYISEKYSNTTVQVEMPLNSVYMHLNADYIYVKTDETQNESPSGWLFYELAEPVITDIDPQDLEILKNLSVEEGGAITFEQTDIHLPIANSIEYLVKNQLVKPSDLAEYVKSADYATSSKGGTIIADFSYGPYVNVTGGSAGKLLCGAKTNEQYKTASDATFISKGTLENIKESLVKSVVDKPFELLNTITDFSELKIIALKASDSGVPYDLSEVVVFVSANFVSNINIYCGASGNAEFTSYSSVLLNAFSSASSNTSNRHLMFSYEVTGGLLHTSHAISASGLGNVNNILTDTIKYIGLATSAEAFGATGTIYVFGRKR